MPTREPFVKGEVVKCLAKKDDTQRLITGRVVWAEVGNVRPHGGWREYHLRLSDPDFHESGNDIRRIYHSVLEDCVT